jgi:hypothetical protein
MTALNGIRKRRIPNHQDHRTRKTPGEPRKRETQKTEMLDLADILSRNTTQVIHPIVSLRHKINKFFFLETCFNKFLEVSATTFYA